MDSFKPEEMGLAATVLSVQIVELLKSKGLITAAERAGIFDAAVKELFQATGEISPGAAAFLRYIRRDET